MEKSIKSACNKFFGILCIKCPKCLPDITEIGVLRYQNHLCDSRKQKKNIVFSLKCAQKRVTVIVLFQPIRNNLPVTHFACQSFLSCLWRAGQGLSLRKKFGKYCIFTFYSKGCIQNHRINEILKSTGKISCLRQRKIKHQFDAQTRGRKYAEIKKSVPRCTVEENGSLSKSSSFSSSLSCFPFLGDSQEPWQGL